MRILIVRLGAIGDIVHTLPAVAALRSSFPSSHIAWAVERGAAASLLYTKALVDQVIELDLRGWRRDPLRSETLVAMRSALGGLRSGHYDLSIDFQGLLKSSVIPLLARVGRRVGFGFSALREPASGVFLTERVEARDYDHMIRKNLKLVEHLGCPPPQEFEFPIACDLDDELFAEQQLENIGGKFAILNPGGGWKTKLWDERRYASIADRMWNRFGIRSVITYGPGEEALAAATMRHTQTDAALPVKATLKQLYQLARRATLFVGGDTGPSHLAAAAGTPLVALFGPTSSRRHGPFSRDDVVIERNDLECRVDCHRRKCDHCSCMDLQLEVVWQGILTRLKRRTSTRDGLAPSHSHAN
jgi:lipopolysaccharide heptosyltransferase I